MSTPKLPALAALAALGVLPATGSAAVIGFLGNFDVINDTGHEAHGFEIELEGLHSNEVTDTFGGAGRGFPSGKGFDPFTAVVRYGAPTVSEYTNGSVFGVRVTYRATFANGAWDYGTPSGNFITPGDNCWTGGGVGYGPSTPCDHFGVGTSSNPTKTTYNWLVENGTPGQLSNGTVVLPAPVWNVTPDPVAPDVAPPVEVAQEIRAPDPGPGQQFGDALWVKVFTTEFDAEVRLEDLIGGEAPVEQAETETEWALLQVEAGKAGTGILESGLGIPIGPNAASIIRRYEFYKYAGLYNAEHEAQPLIGDSQGVEFDPDNPNAPYDVGTYLGAQNGGVNLNMVAAPVPLPPALALLGAPLAALCARRRRAA